MTDAELNTDIEQLLSGMGMSEAEFLRAYQGDEIDTFESNLLETLLRYRDAGEETGGGEYEYFGTCEAANQHSRHNSPAGSGDIIILNKKEMEILQAGGYLSIPGGEYGLVIGYEPFAHKVYPPLPGFRPGEGE